MYDDEQNNEWMMSRISRRVAAICSQVSDGLVVVVVGDGVYYDTVHGVIQSMTKATGTTAIEQAHSLSDVMQQAAYELTRCAVPNQLEPMIANLAGALAQASL